LNRRRLGSLLHLLPLLHLLALFYLPLLIHLLALLHLPLLLYLLTLLFLLPLALLPLQIHLPLLLNLSLLLHLALLLKLPLLLDRPAVPLRPTLNLPILHRRPSEGIRARSPLLNLPGPKPLPTVLTRPGRRYLRRSRRQTAVLQSVLALSPTPGVTRCGRRRHHRGPPRLLLNRRL
jgi:hypothetical protein